MTIGTTTDFNLTRNQLCELALKKVRAIPEEESPSSVQLQDAILALNLILREEDESGEHIWGIGPQPTTIPLIANVFRYTTANGLPNNIVVPTKISYRDASGQDWPVDLINHRQFENLQDKFATGDPAKALFIKHRDRSLQELIIVPTPNTQNVQSEVEGTDTNNYRCIRNHTADANNRPVTGANYLLYWEEGGSSGVAWAEGTSYVAPKLLRMWFKRPLWDFDAASDVPDFPQAYTRDLLYRLCSDLADDYGNLLDERTWFAGKTGRAKERVDPQANTEISDLHNHTEYE